MPAGPTCHTGARSCFNTGYNQNFILELERIINERIESGNADSYVNKLSIKGLQQSGPKGRRRRRRNCDSRAGGSGRSFYWRGFRSYFSPGDAYQGKEFVAGRYCSLLRTAPQRPKIIPYLYTADLPMPNNRTELSALGEFGLIAHIAQSVKLTNNSSLKGIGDDAAIIKNTAACTVVTTDMLVEGVHFDLSYVPLKHLGYKSVVVNLSDVYAMNATPRQITVSIAVSNRFSLEAIEEFYSGVNLACERYGIDLVGGDTTSSNLGFVISVTAIGEAEESNIVYRNTAKENDLVCVSGDLGSAYLGLQLLEREKLIFKENPQVQPDFEGKDYLLERQLKPEARKEIIDKLKELNIQPTSMIDVSDGLSSEILHICQQSQVGCRLCGKQAAHRPTGTGNCT